MNIVCATDNNFVQHCTIMLTSLLLNNKDVIIYLLTEHLDDENILIISNQVESLGGVLKICKVDSSIIERFPMPEDENLSHISSATYYRLLIPHILPSEIEKAIYLDCDIIVNGSIKKLNDVDMTGYALAAVPQIGSGFEALRLGYPIEFGYFNAGVCVINLEYWRKEKISQKLIQYIIDNYSHIKYHDQDALNAILYDKTYHLLPMWNMTSLIYGYFLDKRGDKINGCVINNYLAEKANANKFRSNPLVVHYVSKPKPWQKGCIHPLASLYFQYALKTIIYSNLKQENIIAQWFNRTKYYCRCHLSYIKNQFVRTDKSLL